MGSPLLGALAVLLGVMVCEGSSSSHSLRLFYTGVSEPVPGLPQFVSVGYVDDQPFSQYDSITKKRYPCVSWMEKVEEDFPHYWEEQTYIARIWEEDFRRDLETARKNNESKGFHTLQMIYSCELRQDGWKDWYYQAALDGKNHITFSTAAATWVAVDPMANIAVSKWRKTKNSQMCKFYLEEHCIEYLKRFLDYGKERLLRTEPPVVKVTRKAGYDGMETLICQAYGFYPKEIETTWRKGEEILEHLTFHRNVAPYPDGTYHAWLSIEIDPKERNQYQCHVGHDGLEEPLVLLWGQPTSNKPLIIQGLCVVLVFLIVLSAAIVGFQIHKRNKKLQVDYMKRQETINSHLLSTPCSPPQPPSD